MAPHSSTPAWKIPWMESLVGCSPWGRWGSDTTERLHFHFSLSCIGEGNGNPLQRSCLENPRDGGAWWAAVCGVTQSQTRLNWLSSSSSNIIKYWLYSVCCTIYPWSLFIFYMVACTSLSPTLISLSPSPSPLVTTSLFSISVSLFLLCYMH